MNMISTWLLSIAGIVILSVLSEFVLPEGQINKYTKVIFSFAILLVIIMPLPKLFGKEFDLSKFFPSYDSNLQEDYLYQLNIDKLTALNKQLDEDVKAKGYNNIVISINANVLTEKMEIYSVFVDLCDIEYAQFCESKDIASVKINIRKIIDSYDLLKDVEVKFNE